MKSSSFPVLPVVVFASFLWIGASSAQTSFLLEIDSIETMPGNQIRITFSDDGTGSTSYEVDSSPSIGPVSNWASEPQSQITPLTGTSSEAVLPATGVMRFFRIVGVGGGGGGEAIVSFNTDSISINESDGTVSIPLTFSKPFQGTLFYVVGGSTSLQDIEPLTGQLLVDGLSAAIVVTLVDNIDLNELRVLTVDIGTGPGYEVGAANQASVIIQDDDSRWSGNFREDENPVGFTLKLLRGDSGDTAFLISEGDGVFPQGEFPASVVRTATTFSLSVASVSLPASSSLFDSAAEVNLTLSADQCVAEQTVAESEIDGVATLTMSFPAQPQLNTTLTGPFLMIKQVIKPSSRQVELFSSN